MLQAEKGVVGRQGHVQSPCCLCGISAAEAVSPVGPITLRTPKTERCRLEEVPKPSCSLHNDSVSIQTCYSCVHGPEWGLASFNWTSRGI